MTPEQQKFYYIKTYTDYDVVGDDIDYKVFVELGPKEVVLQFEESDSNADWKNNFLIFPWPLKLELEHNKYKTVWTTYGYAKAYDSTNMVPILEFMQRAAEHPDFKCCVRGWSFGSAMAKIAVRHLEALGMKVQELTTYGDVKCWVNPFYKPKAARVREYTTPNDLVTWAVPFYWRDNKCKVGPRFKIREAVKSEWYHTHYEEYEYTEFE